MVAAILRAEVLIPGSLCAYCGGPAGSVDHRIPTCQGGTDDLENLVPACMPCNQSKGGKTPGQWRAARLHVGAPWPPRWSPLEIESGNNRQRDHVERQRLDRRRRFSGARMARIRQKRRLTLEELARRTRFDLAEVQSWEDGTASPAHEQLSRLSRVLWVRLDDFLTPNRPPQMEE